MPSRSPVRTAPISGETLQGLLLGSTLAAVLLVLGACNTVEGAGKDVQAAGTGIENAAQKAKN